MKFFNFENKSNILTLISLGLIIIFGLFASSKGLKAPQHHSQSGFFFDTIIEITLYDSLSDEEASDILNEATALCKKYENLLSKTISGSDICNINESKGEEIKVDPSTMEILKTACDFAEKSEGIVDPTIGSLTSIWNLKDDDFKVPSDKDIQTALSHVNYKSLNLNMSENLVSKTDPDLKIDLGFIAKGFIADKVKELLESKGISSGIINLGGNVLCIGQKDDNTPFKIGIKDPQNPEQIITEVFVCGQSIVSSGAYERNKTVGGVLYHHILSTKNGYPTSSDLSQVTIINSSSVEGDALSTLCFILGYEKSKEFLQNFYPDVKAVFVDQNGNLLSY